MKYAAAIKHYGNATEISRQIGISLQAVVQWEVKGIVPYHSASLLHAHAGEALPLEPEHYGPGGRILPSAIESVRREVAA